METASDVADENHWTRRTEEVTSGQQEQRQDASVMHPQEDRPEVRARDLRTEQAVRRHRHSDEEQQRLQESSEVLPSEQTPDQRPAKDVRFGAHAPSPRRPSVAR